MAVNGNNQLHSSVSVVFSVFLHAGIQQYLCDRPVYILHKLLSFFILLLFCNLDFNIFFDTAAKRKRRA